MRTSQRMWAGGASSLLVAVFAQRLRRRLPRRLVRAGGGRILQAKKCSEAEARDRRCRSLNPSLGCCLGGLEEFLRGARGGERAPGRVVVWGCRTGTG